LAVVVLVALTIYMRVRQQMKRSAAHKEEPDTPRPLLARGLDSLYARALRGMLMSKIMAQILGHGDPSAVANIGSVAKVVPSADAHPLDPAREWTKQVAIVVAASLFVALCARVTVPLPFTPVPLTLQNFGVLAVGLLLGSRRGFAALSLYLMEGVCGLPVFSMGAGIGHILGLTGGFLIAYPLVAFVAGWIYEQRSEKSARLFAGRRSLP
jgi:hypothetical protein